MDFCLFGAFRFVVKLLLFAILCSSSTGLKTSSKNTEPLITILESNARYFTICDDSRCPPNAVCALVRYRGGRRRCIPVYTAPPVPATPAPGPEGATCPSDRGCQTGLVCSCSRCKRPVPLGGRCPDPCWICAPGLTCIHKVCKRPTRPTPPPYFSGQPYPPPSVPPGGACSTHRRCQPGLVCACSRCKRPVPQGGRCPDPCWICAPGLTCKHKVCSRITRPTQTTRPTRPPYRSGGPCPRC